MGNLREMEISIPLWEAMGNESVSPKISPTKNVVKFHQFLQWLVERRSGDHFVIIYILFQLCW